jgi:hypothetical protein
MFDAANGLVAQASGYGLLYMYEYFLLCPLPSFFMVCHGVLIQTGGFMGFVFREKERTTTSWAQGNWRGNRHGFFVCLVFRDKRKEQDGGGGIGEAPERYLREKMVVVVGVT